MPRDPSGTYTLPLAPVVTDTPIATTWANPTMDDLAQSMTDSLSRSGKGGMTAVMKLVDTSVGQIPASPALQFNSESNSGIYRADQFDIRHSLASEDMLRLYQDGIGDRFFQFWDGTAFQDIIYNGGPANVLANATYLQSRNFADDGFINLIRGTTGNAIELGAATSLLGNLTVIVDDNSANFTSRRSGAQTLAGDEVGRWQSQGTSDLAANINIARIRVFAEADVVSGAITSNMRFETAVGTVTAEAMRINANGDLAMVNGRGIIIGHPTQITVDGNAAEFQVLGTSAPDSSVIVSRSSATISGPAINFYHSRGAIGAHGIVIADDRLGELQFYGDDGISEIKTAIIRVTAEGTIGTGRVPSRMDIFTGSDATTTSVNIGLTIDSAQNVIVPNGNLSAEGAFVLVPTGFVGIGINNPQTPLHIMRPTVALPKITLFNNLNAAFTESYIEFRDRPAAGEFGEFSGSIGTRRNDSASNYSFVIQVKPQGTDVFVIDNIGRVTIPSLAGSGGAVTVDVNGRMSAPL